MTRRPSRGGEGQWRSDATLHAWERWTPLWHASLYAALAATTAVVLMSGPEQRGRSWIIVSLATGLALWFGFWTRSQGIEGRRPVWMAVFFLGMAAMWISLILLDPLFQVVGVLLFVPLCIISLGWAVASGVLLVGGVIGRELLFGEGDPWVEVAAVTITIAFGLGLARYVGAIVEQSRERQRLIEELTATRAELAAAERRAGALGERERLSREIHDALAQGFTSIVMLLEAAEESLASNTAVVGKQIDQALQTARESLGEARRLVRDLPPEPLARGSLADALERLTDRLAEETGIDARTLVTGLPRAFPPGHEVALLRMAQEALANVRRHAGATRATVTLSYMAALATLDVQDDGVGFRTEPAPLDGPSGGFGIRSMRRRLEELGGRLDVESAPGDGTTIVAELPVPQGRGSVDAAPADVGP
jgi:signal transduction histidine kinase